MHFVRIAIAAAAIGSLSACVTPSGQSKTEIEEISAHIVSSRCIHEVRSGDITQSTHKIGSVDVYAVSGGEDDWVSIDSATRGFRDNVYFNTRTGQTVCGGKNWSSQQRVFRRAPTDEATLLRKIKSALVEVEKNHRASSFLGVKESGPVELVSCDLSTGKITMERSKCESVGGIPR